MSKAAGAGRGDPAGTAIVFETLHRYAGVGIGEHLGYLLTGVWTILVGVATLHNE